MVTFVRPGLTPETQSQFAPAHINCGESTGWMKFPEIFSTKKQCAADAPALELLEIASGFGRWPTRYGTPKKQMGRYPMPLPESDTSQCRPGLRCPGAQIAKAVFRRILNHTETEKHRRFFLLGERLLKMIPAI